MAVRALSGLFGLALFPLMWVAGRRLAGRQGAWAAVLVLAAVALRHPLQHRDPHVLAGDGARPGRLAGRHRTRSGDRRRAGSCGLALLCGALLWTHYWAMWFVAAAGLAAGRPARLRARRAGQDDGASAPRARVIAAARRPAACCSCPGCRAALPVGPHRHAVGRARAARRGGHPVPVRLGGGPTGDSVLLGILLLVLILLGLFGRSVDARHVELDLRHAARRPSDAADRSPSPWASPWS